MANLNFQIPDARMQDLIDAWGSSYIDKLPDGSDNPQTKAQFARDQIKRAITDRIRQYEAQQLSEFPIT